MAQNGLFLNSKQAISCIPLPFFPVYKFGMVFDRILYKEFKEYESQ